METILDYKMDDQKSEPIFPQLSKSERKRIEETNYGRNAGWILDYQNQPVALLTNCQFYDMFWDLYNVTYLTEDEAILAKLQDQNFWYEHFEEVVFRNREFTELPPPQPIVVCPKDAPYSMIIRGLYFWIPPTKMQRVWSRMTSWL